MLFRSTDPVRCDQPFNYKDAGFKKGLNYYRLNIKNADGRSSYSTVVALMNAANGFEITGITPSIAEDNYIKLQVTSSNNTRLSLQLVDMSGRKLKTFNKAVFSGTTDLQIDLTNLSSGSYAIIVRSEDGTVRTARFFKK